MAWRASSILSLSIHAIERAAARHATCRQVWRYFSRRKTGMQQRLGFLRRIKRVFQRQE
jgi:hypothetical protein